MFSGLLRNNTYDKIFAICSGLAVCSFTLAVTMWTDVTSQVSCIVIDDVFFGIHSPLVLAFFLTDGVLMLLVALLINQRQFVVIFIGGLWSCFLLIENLFDLFFFSNDFYLVCEEAAFALIYSFLLGLFYHVGNQNYKQVRQKTGTK